MERNPYARDSLSAQRAQGEEDTVEIRSFSRPSEAPAREPAAHAFDAAASQKMSVIGKSLVFKGELKASEDLLIQGRVEGSITHSASHLAIGAHGDVRADIHAQRVIVQGKLEGDVHATESVVVEVSANVRGNIYAPRVSIKDGAKFKGSIDMDGGPPEAAAKSAAPSRRPKPKPDPDANNVDELLS